MKLKTVEEVLPQTRVILRMDLDVPENDNSRLVKSIPTIKVLLEKKCKIAIIGHKGRPIFDKPTPGKPNGYKDKLSLRSVYLDLMMLLEPNGENLIESIFIDDVGDREQLDLSMAKNDIVFLENLRFWKGEESNENTFLKSLVEMCQVYVNDAFAVAHRRHRSIMLHKELPSCFGLAFVDEVEKITKVTENPARPLTIILGGAKEDKLSHLGELTKRADHILIGGKLPKLISNFQLLTSNQKIIIAKLREDTCDLSDEDIENFKRIIMSSGTIVWAGAMGWFEKDDCKKGTLEIARAVTSSNAFNIIAGGDTGASVSEIGMSSKIDLIASGGGVMLELLTKGKLPAWE